jgi:hypothetical protein
MARVYFIDQKDDKGNWQKKWEQLGVEFETKEVSSLQYLLKEGADLSDVSVVVIHMSAVDGEELKALVTSILSAQGRPYVMRVSAGEKQVAETSPKGRNHISRVPFPTAPSDLTHLSEPFQRLIKELESISRLEDDNITIQRRKAAWDKWEGHGRGQPNLAALAILCQGYLAVYADCTGEPEGVPDEDLDDVRVALKRMQWPDLCRGGNGRELLAEALLDDSTEGPMRRSELRSQVLCAGYWHPVANALREQNRSRDKAIEWVKSSEWDALTGQASWGDVKELFSAIWDFSTSNLSPGNVAKAFVQLANRLGTV